MLTVEDIRRKADAPFTKGYQELERLYQTLPELFSKNPFAPIFKSSDKLAINDQPGDAAQQEPGKKHRGQNYLEMRYEDYSESLTKAQGKHNAEGGLRSTLENHFMDEGIRAQAAMPKHQQPEIQGYPAHMYDAEFQEEVYPPPHVVEKHDMYMPQPVMYAGEFEGEYDPYTGEPLDPHYHQMAPYGHPVHGAVGFKQPPDQYMTGYPEYYYQPQGSEPHAGPGFAGPPAGTQPAKQRKARAGGKDDSDEKEERPNSNDGAMVNANYIKNAGVIDDMEMEVSYPYYPQDRGQAYPPQNYHPFNQHYEYMNYQDQGEEEGLQEGVHMMPSYHYGYQDKGQDPHYSPVYMGYEDHYTGYGVPPHMGYDAHGYMHPDYGVPYGQPAYDQGYYPEQYHHQHVQYDHRQQKQTKGKKTTKTQDVNAHQGHQQRGPAGQMGQRKAQQGGQMGQGQRQQPAYNQQNKSQKKNQQGGPGTIGAGGANPNDFKQYQQYRQPVSNQQTYNQGRNNQLQQGGGSKPQGQNKSNGNLPNTEQLGMQNQKKGGQMQSSQFGAIESMPQKKSGQNSHNNLGGQINAQQANQKGGAPGSMTNIQAKQGGGSNQLPMPGQLVQQSSGELNQSGASNQKKKKSPQQPQYSNAEPEFVDDYYEEGGNGQGLNSSSQKSGNRARQVFFVKK